MVISKELLEILACPKCKGDIRYDKGNEKLICETCRLKFSVIDKSIPNMLIDEAESY